MAAYDTYRTSILDRARVEDDSSTDITDDLGIIVSSDSSDNRQQERTAGVNTGVEYAYIDDAGTAEINNSLTVESDSFYPLILMGEVDDVNDKLLMPSKLPEFTFKNQITESKYRKVVNSKFGECTITIAKGEKLQFDFSGMGTSPDIKDGVLITTSAFIDRPIRGEEITVEIDSTTVGVIQNMEIRLNRQTEGRNAVGSGQNYPKVITEGKVQIDIQNLELDIDDDKAWQLVYQGELVADTEYGMKFKRPYTTMNVTLPNGQVMNITGTLYGEVDPQEQNGEDTVRQVTLSGGSLSAEIQNWSNYTS